MTTAEKLTKVAENIPKVYDAGYEKGKSEGGGGVEYEFEDVSLVELNNQGKFTTIYDSSGALSEVLSANQYMARGEGQIISLGGNVEFEVRFGYPFSKVLVDGNVVFDNSRGMETGELIHTFSYKGNVEKSITIYTMFGTFVTFDRFVIRVDYDKGVADGKQAEYDNFWYLYQNGGKKTDYLYGFAGSGWTDNTYNPKYSITPSGNAQYMYSYSAITDTKVPIDISGVVRNLASMFSNTNLVTIRELIVSETTKGLTNVFTNSTRLESITIVGVIATSINMQWCTKLTTASLQSILAALSKNSALANGKIATFAAASQAVIEGNAQCLEQYNLALAAGWEIKFA